MTINERDVPEKGGSVDDVSPESREPTEAEVAADLVKEFLGFLDEGTTEYSQVIERPTEDGYNRYSASYHLGSVKVEVRRYQSGTSSGHTIIRGIVEEVASADSSPYVVSSRLRYNPDNLRSKGERYGLPVAEDVRRMFGEFGTIKNTPSGQPTK